MMTRWVDYISIMNSMCDMHISADFNINVLFHMVNMHAKQQNIKKLIEYVKIIKIVKLANQISSFML